MNSSSLFTVLCCQEKEGYVCLKVILPLQTLISNNNVLGGKDHKLPVQDYSALSAGLFFIVGKLMCHAILHGACCLPGLPIAVVYYLLSGDVDEATKAIGFADIPDHGLRCKVMEVSVSGLVLW